MLEDQKNESSEQNEDDTQQIDTGAMEVTSKSDGSDEKPDINDVPMDEVQVIYIHPKKTLMLYVYEEEYEYYHI